MDSVELKNTLYRIISGKVVCKVGPGYIIFPPTNEQNLKAIEVYEDFHDYAKFLSIPTMEELHALRLKLNLWSEAQQARLDGLIKDIETLKVGFYENSFKKNEERIIRKKLREAEQEVNKLHYLKHSWDASTLEGNCETAMFHFILLSNLRDNDGTKLFKDEDCLDIGFPYFNDVIEKFNLSRIPDKNIRAVAKDEHWRNIWSIEKGMRELFGCSATEMTQDQTSLILWSKLYDNIHQNAECPNDDVLEDDDKLDGWLIVQRRKRQSERDKNEIEAKVGDNPKIKNADEIFVVARDIEEARKIEDMNPIHVKMIIQQRMKKLHKEKFVAEKDMPDTDQDLRLRFERLRKG